MDKKLYIKYETTKSERVYTFNLEYGAPLGDCYAACHEILASIAADINQITEQSKPKVDEVPAEIVDQSN